jgi:hypothetical protein
MAKKKQTKKHKFKYAAPTTGALNAPAVGTTAAASGVTTEVSAKPVQTVGLVTSTGRNFAYVGQDLSRVGIFAVSLIAAELVLWWLFGHTGLGSSVYNLVHV